MTNNTKKAIGVIIALIIAISFVALLAKFTFNKDGVDQYGWEHGADTGATYDTDENLSRDYALIDYDKDTMAAMDAHTFINTVKPILETYYDGQWRYATFVFGDGTGLYFPYSDITQAGVYGEIDETGTFGTIYGTVEINGGNVKYTEATQLYSVDNGKVREMLEALPAEYQTDNLSGFIDNETLYISFWAPVEVVNAEGKIIESVMSEEEGLMACQTMLQALQNVGYEDCGDFKSVNFYVANNECGYSMALTDENISYEEDLGYEIEELFDSQNYNEETTEAIN